MKYLRRGVMVLFTVVGMLASLNHVAHATTGPEQVLSGAVKVNNKFSALFVGQYGLKSIPASAHIQSAAMGIEPNDNGFLYGVAQFYGYDKSGSQTTWVATLYYFRQVGKSQMSIQLLAPGSKHTILGYLYLAPPNKGNLVGKIELGTNTYPITFHQISKK
jgi:hypothetical protein